MAADRPPHPRTEGLADLVARREYTRAIEILKVKLAQRPLDPHTQLQLADTLIRAGRGGEALPVLLQLAEVFAADGFFAKAVAILKRVDKIEPGRADVRDKLALFVEKQRGTPGESITRTFPAPAITAPTVEDTTTRPAIEFGMEELGIQTLTRLRVRKPASPDEPAPLPVLEPPVLRDPEPDPEPPAPITLPAIPSPMPAPSSLETRESLGTRLRSVLRRYLGATSPGVAAPAVPPSEPAPEPPPPPMPIVDNPLAPQLSPVEPSPPSAHLQQVIEMLPPQTEGAAPDANGTASSSPEATGADAPAIEVTEIIPEPDETPAPAREEMTTAEFQEKVLDIVQDLVQQPPRAPSAASAVEAPAPPALFETATLFAALTRDEVFALVAELGLMHYEPGDVIVTEGEPGDSLFLIGDGRVKVFVRSPEGRGFAVGELREGDFFGEISALSGRPRSATVTAASECNLLRLDRARLDALTAQHPHVRDVLEDLYLRRAGSPMAAAVRILETVEEGTEQRAVQVLESYFGESRWPPLMRLRLADALARAGNKEDAAAILLVLADDLARAGYPERAVAIVKKVEELEDRVFERAATDDADDLSPFLRPDRGEGTADGLARWVVDLARDAAHAHAPGATAAPVEPPERVGLRGSPLFEGLSDDEMLALVRGLNLRQAAPGDVLVSEGERGESVFVLACGQAKVFARASTGASTLVGTLPQGAFFGEIAALSGGRRTATVVASAHCELLELTRDALDAMTAAHPRVRESLQRSYETRSTLLPQ